MKFLQYVVLMTWAISILGCSKGSYSNSAEAASLTLVNAVVGSNPLVTNFTGSVGGKVPDSLSFYATAAEISYGSFMEFSSYSGATALSVSPITDTTLSLWSGTLNLPVSTIHSLFIIGPDSLQIDTLFTTDSPIPHSMGDSNVGIRFVNLSPGSNPVSVDLQGNAPGSITASLSYKGITAFADFPVNAETPTDYIFEFRDASSGMLLAQYDMGGLNNGSNGNTNEYRWRNFTICLYGLPNSQSAMLVNNY